MWSLITGNAGFSRVADMGLAAAEDALMPELLLLLVLATLLLVLGICDSSLEGSFLPGPVLDDLPENFAFMVFSIVLTTSAQVLGRQQPPRASAGASSEHHDCTIVCGPTQAGPSLQLQSSTESSKIVVSVQIRPGSHLYYAFKTAF